MGLLSDYRNHVEKSRSLVDVVDQVFVESYPSIHEYMTTWELDGKERMVSTITLGKVPEGYRVALNDPQMARSISATDETFFTAMDQLEAIMCDPNKEWFSWRRSSNKAKVAKNTWNEQSNGDASRGGG